MADANPFLSLTDDDFAPPKPGAAPGSPDFARMIQITQQAESGGRDTNAQGGVLTSPAGAQGRMQVMPSTAANPGYGVRPAQDDSPNERARVGQDYLGAMLTKYGSPDMAWAAYNAGPAAVDAAVKKAGPNGNWLGQLPGETQSYVQSNLSALNPPAAPAAPAPAANPFLSLGEADFNPPPKSTDPHDTLLTPDALSTETGQRAAAKSFGLNYDLISKAKNYTWDDLGKMNAEGDGTKNTIGDKLAQAIFPAGFDQGVKEGWADMHNWIADHWRTPEDKEAAKFATAMRQSNFAQRSTQGASVAPPGMPYQAPAGLSTGNTTAKVAAGLAGVGLTAGAIAGAADVAPVPTLAAAYGAGQLTGTAVNVGARVAPVVGNAAWKLAKWAGRTAGTAGLTYAGIKAAEHDVAKKITDTGSALWQSLKGGD